MTKNVVSFGNRVYTHGTKKRAETLEKYKNDSGMVYMPNVIQKAIEAGFKELYNAISICIRIQGKDYYLNMNLDDIRKNINNGRQNSNDVIEKFIRKVLQHKALLHLLMHKH